MLFTILVLGIPLVAYFVAVSMPQFLRGRFKVALWVIPAASFVTAFAFMLVSAAATGISDEEKITTRWVDGKITTYQSDGTTMYTFRTKDNWNYTVSGAGRTTIRTTNAGSSIVENCGVAPDWTWPFHTLGECSDTFWLNNSDLE